MTQNDNKNSLNTKLLQENDEDIRIAAEIIARGGLVAFPTETVYGLGGNALSPDASAAIYAAKGRPSDNPLIVHIAEVDAVYKLATSVPDKARELMEAFWPGPLTIILPKSDLVPHETTGGLNTVAIRMPAHPAALKLIKDSGVYIAAPSANTSGRPSPTTAQHVEEDLMGRIDAILDGGPVGIGIESTIIDLTEEIPSILRPGYITKAQLESIIGEVQVDPALIHPDPNLRPKAPGMKYTHYAPKGNLTIVESMQDTGDAAVAEAINKLYEEKKSQGFKVLILAPEEHAGYYDTDAVLNIGKYGDGSTVAAKLYGALRKCDDLDADFIYSESFRNYSLGGAIMNRLLKAAGQEIINV